MRRHGLGCPVGDPRRIKPGRGKARGRMKKMDSLQFKDAIDEKPDKDLLYRESVVW